MNLRKNEPKMMNNLPCSCIINNNSVVDMVDLEQGFLKVSEITFNLFTRWGGAFHIIYVYVYLLINLNVKECEVHFAKV